MKIKWYGSVDNRLEENKMYCDGIYVGTPMTEYFYSDSHAYETVKVIDQKHVFVRQYKATCIGGFASNEWKLESDETKPLRELKFRYGSWWDVQRWKPEHLNNFIFWSMPEEVRKKLENGEKEVVTYKRTPGGISFGIAKEYYDYSF